MAWIAEVARCVRPLPSLRLHAPAGRKEVSAQIAEFLVLTMALAAAALNLATGILRLLEVERGRRHRKVCGGRHRR